MGKPTGFLEYERKNAKAEAPLERIKHFNEFHTPAVPRGTTETGSQMYGMWCSVLPGRTDAGRYDVRLSAAEPGA